MITDHARILCGLPAPVQQTCTSHSGSAHRIQRTEGSGGYYTIFQGATPGVPRFLLPSGRGNPPLYLISSIINSASSAHRNRSCADRRYHLLAEGNLTANSTFRLYLLLIVKSEFKLNGEYPADDPRPCHGGQSVGHTIQLL